MTETLGHIKSVTGADRGRISSIDCLRGLAMILMALDHTREFLTNVPINPLDPTRTTALLYVTRWLTHLCAPTFIFLAGTATYLQQGRKSLPHLKRFLFTRGLWLIVMELTAVSFVFNFTWRWNVQLLEVIWVIGVSMMFMSALVCVGVRWNFILGVLMITGHNALDRVPSASFGRGSWLWRLLHVPGLITSSATAANPPLVIVAYPLIPWIGVMALGYAFGSIVSGTRAAARSFLLKAGTCMLAAFALLRWSNLYGDPQPWRDQGRAWRTLLSFLNLEKYPPSLLFLLATLGVAALVLAMLTHSEDHNTFARPRRWIEVYGRVPFFFFLLHLATIHAAALLLSVTTDRDWRWWITGFPAGGVLMGRPPGFGFGLLVVWSVWVAVVVICYPACKWYAAVKSRSRNVYLSYL